MRKLLADVKLSDEILPFSAGLAEPSYASILTRWTS